MGFLRLWLAIAVYLEHLGANGWPSNLYPVTGFVAVSAFYIISGFLIQLIIAQNYYGKLAFWKSRFLRIYPLYWLILACSILFILLIPGHVEPRYYLHPLVQTQAMPAEIWHYQLIADDPNLLDKLMYVIGNIAIFSNDLSLQFVYDLKLHHFIETNNLPFIGYLLGNSFFLIPQAWTLAIELCFYLVAPFLLTRHVTIIIGVALLSFFSRSYIYEMGWNGDALIFSSLYIFLSGSLACRFYLKFLKDSQESYKGIAALLLAAIVTYSLAYRSLSMNDKNYVFYGIVVVAQPFLFRATKDYRLDRFLGDLSYPIYLCHFFTYAMSEVLFSGYTASNMMPVLTMLFATFAVFCIERPLDNYRHRKFRKTQASVSNSIDSDERPVAHSLA